MFVVFLNALIYLARQTGFEPVRLSSADGHAHGWQVATSIKTGRAFADMLYQGSCNAASIGRTSERFTWPSAKLVSIDAMLSKRVSLSLMKRS
jgi:hypothetical protein